VEVAPEEVRAHHGAEDLGVAEDVLVGLEAVLADDDAPVAPRNDRVTQVGSDRERQVRRQGPRCRGPGEQPEWPRNSSGPSSIGSRSNRTVTAGSVRSR